jgi:hypothetical protein
MSQDNKDDDKEWVIASVFIICVTILIIACMFKPLILGK